MRSWAQRATLAGIVAALAWPVLINSDGFPLSTYPMYSRARAAEVGFVTAHGVEPDGTVVPLGLDVIGASDDPLVVAGELRAAVRAGRAEERCALVLERLLDDRSDAARLVVRVVTERHDVIEHTADRPSLIERTVHAECGGVL
jgi:hypothetical protein